MKFLILLLLLSTNLFARYSGKDRYTAFVNLINYVQLPTDSQVIFYYVVNSPIGGEYDSSFVAAVTKMGYTEFKPLVSQCNGVYYDFYKRHTIKELEARQNELIEVFKQFCNDTSRHPDVSYGIFEDARPQSNDVITCELLEEKSAKKDVKELYQLGMQLYNSGVYLYSRYTSCLLRNATERGLNKDSAYYTLGILIDIDYFFDALKLNPGFEYAYERLGAGYTHHLFDTTYRIVFNRKKLSGLRSLLRKGTKLYPDNEHLHLYLARLEYFFGEKENAIRELKQSIMIKKDPDAQELLDEIEAAESIKR